ncbi:MAG: lysozyme [Rhodospirillaceae bacterium]|nr:lysozyme [Rhodospirillales bacterium]
MTAIDYPALEGEMISVEGLKLTLYRCTAGKVSIGVGRNLEDRGISEDEARYMVRNDIKIIEHELDAAIPWWRDLSGARQRAIINMAFMGVPRLLQFKHMLAALRVGDWKQAADEALNSKWARDVQPARVEMVRRLLVEG